MGLDLPIRTAVAQSHAPVIREVPYGSADYVAMTGFRDLHLRRPLGLVQTSADLAGEDRQVHIAAFESDRVVGTVLLKPLEPPRIKLRQMVTAPEMRRTGLGSRLVRYAEAVAFERGFRTIELNARAVVRAFYEALGYRVEGEEFLEIGLPHVRMLKTLAGKPA